MDASTLNCVLLCAFVGILGSLALVACLSRELRGICKQLEQVEQRTKRLQNSLSELHMSNTKLWTSQDRVNHGQSEINRSVRQMLKNLTEQGQPHGES